MQRKTQRPVQFEITPTTREALEAWIKAKGLKGDGFLFPSRVRAGDHLGTRQYARIVHHWMNEIGLDGAAYGTHSLRRTKPSLIYRRTKNLRAVQLLLGHSKLESTVRYLGIVKPRRTLGRYARLSEGSLASATACMSWDGGPIYWLVVAAHPQA
jgi:integrase